METLSRMLLGHESLKFEETKILLDESEGEASCWLCRINVLYTVDVADPSLDENIESDIIPQWLTGEKPVNFFLLKWAL